MFAELVLPVDLPVDRDEVEDSIMAALGGQVEVTGSGSGLGASNLDLDVTGDPMTQMAAIRGVVRSLGIVGATLRFEGHPPEAL